MKHNDLFRLTILGATGLLALGLAGCGSGEALEGESREQTAETAVADSGGDEQERGFFTRLFDDQPRTYEVPAGTVLTLRFEDHLSSHASQAGQSFRATVTQAVSIDGEEAIPPGAVVLGTVTQARGPKKVGGRAQLALDFHTLRVPDAEPVAIAAAFSARGKSETPKDAAIIGGSTIAGALLGEEIEEGDGGVVGAVIGGLAGTAAAVKTKGKPVEIASGTVMSIELTAPVTVRVD